MQLNFKEVKVLFSSAENLDEIKKLSAKKIFDENICFFLNELSTLIRKDPEAKRHPDILTFGFFCRKSNVEKLKQIYYQDHRIGRGLSFHIAPSNVPINFAYSMVAGLLAGNSCVVRVSTKEFEQTSILCRLIKKAVENSNSDAGKYISIIQYERNKKINDYLSSLADVRVVWGGDSTISSLRESTIPARCVEVTFADRYSICVLYANELLKISNWNSIAQGFYNDTYLYDQNACSSPRLMYWIGQEKEILEAKRLFWDSIYEYTKEKYKVQSVIAVDKLTTDYRAAIELDDIRIEKKHKNLIHRIHLEHLVENLPDFVCPGGSFLEYDSENLNDLIAIINKKYQTISYLGGNGNDIAEWVEKNGLSGIDRIVPMGKTADFTLTWDGYNLIETMSRYVFIV